jgi:ABC-type polysaccharide/polyol phosphate transport system ATPase subunit
MSLDPIISVRNVSKAYRIWENPAARLASSCWQSLAGLAPKGSAVHAVLRRRATRCYRDFFALRDVSLSVGRGESMGIIGRNGSGKSTLLQIIAGTLQPTTGTVEVHGRVAALLELGSGFNPDFTGRENVFLNGAVLGLGREQVAARFEAIAAFAEIGDFIEQPIKTYSSGMVLRLAFAVAANVDPDILIVDEALAVGDARFQLKCARVIDRFIAQGVALFFVSHDASMVKRLCKRAILLEQGNLVYAGRPNDVVNLYSKLIADSGSVEALAQDIAALQAAGPAATPDEPVRIPDAAPAREADATARSSPSAAPDAPAPKGGAATLPSGVKAMETIPQARPQDSALAQQVEKLLADERSHVQVSGREFAYGGELGRIHEVAIQDAAGQPRTWFSSGEPVIIRMIVEARERLPEPIYALTVKNVAGVEIYGTNTLFSSQPAPSIDVGDRRVVTFSFNIDLMPGHYFLSFGFTHFLGDELVVIHRRYDAIKIEVHGVDRSFGIANLKAVIRSQALPSDGAVSASANGAVSANSRA